MCSKSKILSNSIFMLTEKWYNHIKIVYSNLESSKTIKQVWQDCLISKFVCIILTWRIGFFNNLIGIANFSILTNNYLPIAYNLFRYPGLITDLLCSFRIFLSIFTLQKLQIFQTVQGRFILDLFTPLVCPTFLKYALLSWLYKVNPIPKWDPTQYANT